MKAAKKPIKQLPLFDTSVELREKDLETDADRQERYRLAQIAKKADEEKHKRWQQHNLRGFNRRPCPCSSPKCKAARAGR